MSYKGYKSTEEFKPWNEKEPGVEYATPKDWIVQRIGSDLNNQGQAMEPLKTPPTTKNNFVGQ